MKLLSNTKRNIAIAISLMLLIFPLAACSTGEGTPSPTPSASEGDSGSSGKRNAPLIWKVEGDTTLYLFGSIHVGQEDLYPLDDVIENAYAECDYLAVEADILSFQEKLTADAEYAATIMPYMYYTDGTTAETVLGEDLYTQAMELLVKQDGITEQMVAMCKPYTLSSMLSSIAIKTASLDENYGIDMYFLKKAKEDGKEVLEVESIEFQLDMFDKFSDGTNQMLIQGSLNPAMGAIGLNAIYGGWKLGEEKSLVTLFSAQSEADPEYYDAMFTSRNLTMADVAETYIAEGKDTFYVVGLAHMLGDGGIVDLLTERGYTVTLLDIPQK